MSRALSLALVALTLGSNALGGVAWLCHQDGLTHEEPCCETTANTDPVPQLAEAPCCEQLSALRVTQAVERVESSTPRVVVLAVLAVAVTQLRPALDGSPENPPRPWTGPPRPGGGPLLAQGRSLLI